jgi:DUF971 family protein
VTRPHPIELKLNRATRMLKVAFDSGETFEMSSEYLRVHSPSAEVQGHAPSQRVLQLDKQRVQIRAIHPVGNYAVVLEFDDGHKTGIYSWDTLYALGRDHEQNWARYQAEVAAARA